MKTRISLNRLSTNPCVAGRWWLCVSAGMPVADWVDCLAVEAQKNWPGRVAVLDVAATLISNLRVWENMILPTWQRDGGAFTDYEAAAVAAFDRAGIAAAARQALVARLPAMLDRQDKRLVMLLRAVLIGAECVIIEDDLWRELCSYDADSPLARLFVVLQQAMCLIVVGVSPAPTGFAVVEVMA